MSEIICAKCKSYPRFVDAGVCEPCMLEDSGFYEDAKVLRDQYKQNICKCEFCGAEFLKGSGVDHELNEKTVVQFCSMDHFKAWIDQHMEDQQNHEDKVLRWSNGEEWGQIEHPEFGMVMTYWKQGTPCYDTYTAPRVSEDKEIYCERFCQDSGMWKETIWIGEYEGEEEIAFW